MQSWHLQLGTSKQTMRYSGSIQLPGVRVEVWELPTLGTTLTCRVHMAFLGFLFSRLQYTCSMDVDFFCVF